MAARDDLDAATAAGRRAGRSDQLEAARRLLPRGAGSPALDRLAELAARLVGTVAAQVSLLTEVQTVVGSAGPWLSAAGGVNVLADSLCAVTAACGGPLVVADARSDARVARLLPVLSGLVGAYLGMPLVDVSGCTVGVLCAFAAAARDWSADEVALLRQLAAFTVTELELTALEGEHEAAREQWTLAVDAADIGGFDYDLRTGQIEFDQRTLDLFGYDRASFDRSIGAFSARVHQEDLPRVAAAAETAIRTCGVYETEYRVVRPDGTTRWVRGRGRVLCDETGAAVRMLGVTYDTTAVVAAETRVTRMLETVPVAIVSLSADWRFTYLNSETERILGRSRADLLGGDVWALFPAMLGTVFEDSYRTAVRTGRPVTFEAYYPAPLDSWFEVRATPTPDGLWVHFLDVSLRHAVERQTDEIVLRTALLTKVTADLTGTLDLDEAAARLAGIVIPDLADWCLVSLVDDRVPGWLHQRNIGSSHRDPALVPAVARYGAVRMSALRPGSVVGDALSSGEVIHLPAGATDALAGSLDPGEARDLVRRLAPEALLALPLIAGGRQLGLLTLFYDIDSRHSAGGNQRLATEIASRVALALDNARLYDRQRRIAEVLQRSLLTPPRTSAHLQVAARYQPAAETAQVGGDWYDGFRQADGATVLVIGDVVGHDIQAAAAMGRLRGLLRGIAVTTGDGPQAILSRLDTAMETLDDETTATAVVCRIENATDRVGRPVTRLRWSNAGHPPPLLLSAAGRVRALDSAAPDLMLGIAPGIPRGECGLTLPAGATVLLYTDGLVERRGQSLDDGLRRLRRALAGLAGRSVEELCDEVLRRMVPDRTEDDVALAAVRVAG